MEKLQGTSMDIVQDNIEKLKGIFPEIFIEGKIDFEVLKQLLGEKIETDKEKYSFTWNGKTEARQIAQDTSTGTLRPSKEDSKDWDNTENLYIEGDNLEVLKLLQKSYHGKIKMIYIDPPYNTGKDFVYKDNFKDNIDNYLTITGQKSENSMGGGYNLTTNPETNGRYHSNWLSMMYPRLKLARNLLTDDGVIFISIDDNEQGNLKKLCDEIFGEENFIDCITWNKRVPKNDNKGIGNIHEYVNIYVKNSNFTREFTMQKEGLEDIYELLENLKKKKIPILEAEKELKKFYNKKGYDRGITLYNNLDNNYEPWGKINMSWPNGETFGPKYEVLHPLTRKQVKVPDRGWRWNYDTFMNNVDYKNSFRRDDGSFICGRIWFAKDEKIQPSSIKYLKDVDKMLLRSIISLKSDGGIEVEKIFDGKSFFSYPKPVSLIRILLNSLKEKDGYILDFFSGSATTAHAVMQLNAEDGGNRKYIMIQLPEPCEEKSEAYKTGYKNICEIGKERIRRAGEKIKEELEKENSQLKLGEELKKLPDIGFKVFKLDSSNIKEWDSETEDLKQSLFESIDNIKSDRTSLDVLYEILLKYGLDLNVPIEENKNFYSIGGGTLLVNLNKEIDMEVVDSICEEYRDLLEIDEDFKTTVVLRDSAFKNDVDKTNAMKKLEQSGIKEVRSI